MMIILEDFIIDLLEKGIIKNYVAENKAVEDFYVRKYEKKAECSYEDFFKKLWYFWYVDRYTEKNVHFDRRWINYFKKKRESTEVQPKKKVVQSNYVTQSKCLLCNVKFTDQTAHDNHLNGQNHIIRMQYVRDKNQFTLNEDLDLEIVKINNLKNNGSSKKLQIETKTRVKVTLNITNKSSSAITITDIVKINPMIIECALLKHFERGVLLNPDSSLVFDLDGYFENSASFIFPLVICADFHETGAKKLVLKEILIEAVSEFSDLKALKTFTFKQSKKLSIRGDGGIIIPGQRPDLYASYYRETLALMPFKISREFENILRNLIRIYPCFVSRNNSISTPYFHKKFSTQLQIPPEIQPDNYYDTLNKLLDIEENQMKLDIREFDTVSTLKALRGESVFELEVPGLAEARPSLLVYDSILVKINFHDKVKYQGIVHKVLEKSVHLGFNHRFCSKFLPNMKYHIEFGFSRRPIKVEKQALHLANQHEIVPFFYPKESIKEHPRTLQVLNFFNRNLNEEQKSAVRNILACKSAPYIIFGPPGTGKTVTVVECILQIWKNEPPARVLVCAPSNAAANEVAIRLIQIIPQSEIFRFIGSVCGAMNKGAKMALLNPIMNIRPDGEFYFPSMEDLLKRRVLVTTIVTAARLVNGGVPEGHFDYVFIDESGYATETQTLIPIAGILSSEKARGKIAGQVVLAGDPRQLGPLVHSQFVKDCGYGTSMLERLLDTCEIYSRKKDPPYDARYVTKLMKNYRSHENILHVPNKLFYRRELIAAGDDLTQLFVDWVHLKNEKFPMIFHHVEGQDEREESSPSFFNVQEIEEVVGYLSKLLASRVKGKQITQDHIGVITPYRKQAEKLRTACSKKGWRELLVGSVEQFQGKEKLVVIVSTVRSKNCHKFEEIDKVCQLGFLKNPKAPLKDKSNLARFIHRSSCIIGFIQVRSNAKESPPEMMRFNTSRFHQRFNVALTRARALLVIVGNAHVLRSDTNWSSFIDYCSENGAIAGKCLNSSISEE